MVITLLMDANGWQPVHPASYYDPVSASTLTSASAPTPVYSLALAHVSASVCTPASAPVPHVHPPEIRAKQPEERFLAQDILVGQDGRDVIVDEVSVDRVPKYGQ